MYYVHSFVDTASNAIFVLHTMCSIFISSINKLRFKKKKKKRFNCAANSLFEKQSLYRRSQTYGVFECPGCSNAESSKAYR